MRSIYSSKLFISSKYKDRIVSAIENPVNAKLVAQIKEYVDLDSLPDDLKKQAKKSKDSKLSNTDTINKYSNLPDAKSNMSKEPSSIPNSHKFDAGRVDDNLPDDNLDDNSQQTEGNTDNNLDDKQVNSSTSLNSATVLYPNNCCDANLISTNIIMTQLNSVDSTSGVIRVEIHNDEYELWVYYNDKINLNNVMTDVIQNLSASNYSYLTFNRLARSENAIVFEISTTASIKLVPDEK